MNEPKNYDVARRKRNALCATVTYRLHVCQMCTLHRYRHEQQQKYKKVHGKTLVYTHLINSYFTIILLLFFSLARSVEHLQPISHKGAYKMHAQRVNAFQLTCCLHTNKKNTNNCYIMEQKTSRVKHEQKTPPMDK